MTDQATAWIPDLDLLGEANPRVDNYILEPKLEYAQSRHPGSTHCELRLEGGALDPWSDTYDEKLPDPYNHCGALCIEVRDTAKSLVPYAKKLYDIGGLNRQKVILLPDGRPRSCFLHELRLLGAFDIGPREAMKNALKEGREQAEQDALRLHKR